MAKCKNCKKENEKKTRVHICDSCKKEMLTCPCCGGEKSKSQYSLCQKCSHENEEYKKKMSKSCKGKPSWNKGLTKETDERVEKISISKKDKPSWNKGLTKETDDVVKKIAESKKGISPWNKGKVYTPEEKKNYYGPKHTEESKEKIRKSLLKRIKNGKINGSPKSKIYEHNGVKVQGGSELKWIKENYDMIVSEKKTGIMTPYGMYFPDFETKDYYVEVKSRYTYEKMLNKTQFKKIRYTNDNIKKLKIYIDEGSCWSIIDAGVDWAMKISDQNP
jgi:hypothetical protein